MFLGFGLTASPSHKYRNKQVTTQCDCGSNQDAFYIASEFSKSALMLCHALSHKSGDIAMGQGLYGFLGLYECICVF